MNRGLIYLVLVLPSIWAFCQKRSWTEHGIADRECFYGFFAGFPQVEYRWMKDGVFLSDFSSEHFYKIQSVSRSDAGNYRCYAKNSVGTIISEKIKLTVACKYLFFFFYVCTHRHLLNRLNWIKIEWLVRAVFYTLSKWCISMTKSQVFKKPVRGHF